jgi:hypothetical protein
MLRNASTTPVAEGRAAEAVSARGFGEGEGEAVEEERGRGREDVHETTAVHAGDDATAGRTATCAVLLHELVSYLLLLGVGLTGGGGAVLSSISGSALSRRYLNKVRIPPTHPDNPYKSPSHTLGNFPPSSPPPSLREKIHIPSNRYTRLSLLSYPIPSAFAPIRPSLPRRSGRER